MCTNNSRSFLLVALVATPVMLSSKSVGGSCCCGSSFVSTALAQMWCVLSAALKNLLRGALLAIVATFVGCFLIYTLPDLVAAQLNRPMPYWFYESEVSSAASPAIHLPI